MELPNALSFCYKCYFLFEVKMAMFYSVQTTNLTFASKKMRYAINSYSIV
jgi:hypothetical protein